jgi:hypothetical protein
MWVPNDAIQVVERSIDIYNLYEFHFAWKIERVHDHLYWWYLGVFQDDKKTCEALGICFEQDLWEHALYQQVKKWVYLGYGLPRAYLVAGRGEAQP